MALTNLLCRRCLVPLTEDNARIYRGRWVGACRKCESAEATARYHAKKEVDD